MSNKEEQKGEINLHDFVRGKLPTESNISTIHNSTSRVKPNSFVRCTFKGGNKKTMIMYKDNEDMPIRGSRCQKTQTTRMYDSYLLQNQDQGKIQYKRVLLSDLTGMRNRPHNIKRNNYHKKQLSINRASSSDHLTVKVNRLKGYQSKTARMQKQQQTMSMLFGNYQRFSECKLEKGLIGKLRKQIISKEANKFVMLRKL